jgi:MoaA/NifB/PqqE/SkfB family radical SAM enzyme
MTRYNRAVMILRYLFHRWRRLHPVDVEAVLSNKCNIHCIYCRYPSISGDELSTEQWKKIIKGFAELGTLRFKLHGGEPTLRTDFSELAAAIRNCGMISAAVTNGIVIADRPELLEHLDELVVSFDSPRREVNDLLRGRGSYDGVVRTLDHALKRGIAVYVNMVLTKENLPDLEMMLEFCERRGVKMNAQPVAFGGYYYNDRALDLALTADEIRSVHQRLIKWKREGRGLLFSCKAYEQVLKWPDYHVFTVPSHGTSPCAAGNEYIRLESNGDVIPCCQFKADFQPRNILKDGLRESLLHVQTHNCGRCWLVYYNERNLLFKFHPAAIFEALRRT